ncbi:MAG: purine-nucleoside phosphorylase [Opitutales bacterium]
MTTRFPLPAALTDPLGDFRPDTGLVLGSGLGFFADERIEPVATVPYADLPDFPVSTVSGHAGRFVFGTIGDRKVVCMQGRVHFYEGYSLREITLPVRLMAGLGVKTLFLTNAAGGINPSFQPGTLMVLNDHINLLGGNPLMGPNADSLGTRFPDMSAVYDPALRAGARELGASMDVPVTEGVYLATTGPSYETPAEIRMMQTLGADAVGMSTVPEAIVARHAGMRVCGISCITNLAAGLGDQPLSHDEVQETANRVKHAFADLLAGLVTG